MELRKFAIRVPAFLTGRKAREPQTIARAWRQPCVVGDPRHARQFRHENRETSGAPATVYRGQLAGKGASRTTRMHGFEESDRGVVPMNHSNKGGPPPAESEEGRLPAKENTHPSHTCPTPCGKRVSQGLMGVR